MYVYTGMYTYVYCYISTKYNNVSQFLRRNRTYEISLYTNTIQYLFLKLYSLSLTIPVSSVIGFTV